MIIRPIQDGDEAKWRALWQGYLTFYKVSLAPDVTDNTWARISESRDGFSAFVALSKDADGKDEMVGFAICLLHPSTWSPRPSCYLEDLYVNEAARGKGAGRALIETVYKFAEALKCHRVYWHTDEDNHVARRLYDKVGSYSKHLQYRRPGD